LKDYIETLKGRCINQGEERNKEKKKEKEKQKKEKKRTPKRFKCYCRMQRLVTEQPYTRCTKSEWATHLLTRALHVPIYFFNNI
jgi:hypothetical protein